MRAVLPSAPVSAPSPGAAALARRDLRDRIARLERVRDDLVGRLAGWWRVVVSSGCPLSAVGG